MGAKIPAGEKNGTVRTGLRGHDIAQLVTGMLYRGRKSAVKPIPPEHTGRAAHVTTRACTDRVTGLSERQCQISSPSDLPIQWSIRFAQQPIAECVPISCFPSGLSDNSSTGSSPELCRPFASSTVELPTCPPAHTVPSLILSSLLTGYSGDGSLSTLLGCFIFIDCVPIPIRKEPTPNCAVPLHRRYRSS